MIGKALAHYHVVAKLGEGGMGVVYRATDTKLARDVAIKVLPAAVANDPERLARFEREARTLASLNHPNIAAVYGVEQGALVMELVEGQTLAERIQTGAIPLDEALPIARQIVDALEAAHEKGIIHRDLKPANVKITPDGVVKLLDFGLAKAMEADTSAGNPESSPTLTIGSSRTGVIMGTAGYMSPEQARGGRVDRRTDIWAYGVVLYEMVAGRTLFQGETISDTLAAVLTKEPDLGVVPASLRPLLRRCLQRDAKKRLGWIGEAHTALDQPPAEVSAPPRRGWMLPVLAAALLIALGTIAALISRTPKQQELPVRRFALAAPTLLDLGRVRSATISPNGRRIAYVAEGRIWVRELDREDSRTLEGTEGAEGPFWSPDGEHIGFWARSQMWKVSTAGGSPVSLCPAPGTLFGGGAWSGDGTTVLFTNAGTGLVAVTAAGGEPRSVFKPSAEEQNFWAPSFLPGEAGSGWILLGVGIVVGQEMVAANLQTGERRSLGRGNFPVYSSSGHIIFRREGSGTSGGLWAVPFSVKELKTTGEAFLLAAGGSHPNVAHDGTLVFTDRMDLTFQMVLRDRGGKQLGTLGAPQPGMSHVVVSPDGRRAMVDSTELGSQDIWIHDLDRSSKSRITSDPGSETFPKWSPDGKQIVFRSNRGISLQAADGSGKPDLIAAGPGGAKVPGDWSLDGNYIVYATQGGASGSNDIWYLKRKQDGKGFEPAPFLQTRFQETSGRISPNGRYLAYVSDESGRFEVFVRPFPEGPGMWPVSTKTGVQPRWSRDGKELFYLEGGVLMAVEVSTQGTFTADTPKRLFTTGTYQNEWSFSKYDVMPDGRFLFLEPVEGNDTRPASIHVVENWPAAFRRDQGTKQP